MLHEGTDIGHVVFKSFDVDFIACGLAVAAQIQCDGSPPGLSSLIEKGLVATSMFASAMNQQNIAGNFNWYDRLMDPIVELDLGLGFEIRFHSADRAPFHGK